MGEEGGYVTCPSFVLQVGEFCGNMLGTGENYMKRTVDGSEIRRTSGYLGPVIYRVKMYIQTVVVLEFLFHQQYHPETKIMSTKSNQTHQRKKLTHT